MNNFEIRTMASDIEAVKASGGSIASSQLFESSKEPIETAAEQPKSVFKIILLIFGALLIAVIIGFLSYYLVLNVAQQHPEGLP